jgi:hypothetical protein
MGDVLARIFLVLVFLFYMSIAIAFIVAIVGKWIDALLKRKLPDTKLNEGYAKLESGDQHHTAS